MCIKIIVYIIKLSRMSANKKLIIKTDLKDYEFYSCCHSWWKYVFIQLWLKSFKVRFYNEHTVDVTWLMMKNVNNEIK